jgi:hypothetical protein
VSLADPEDYLERDLGLSDAAEAFDSGPLAVLLVYIRRDPLDKLCQKQFMADKIPITSEGNDPRWFL